MEGRSIENPSMLGAVDIIERLSALMTPRTGAITTSNFILMVVWMMVGWAAIDGSRIILW
jgi:hypothetical protein